MEKKARTGLWLSAGLFVVCCFAAWKRLQTLSQTENYISHVSSRHLLSIANCTPPAINQFPPDLFTEEQRENGAIVVHIIVSLYMFIGLAIVCDDYFVPSLERICQVLKLQPDVAGATFMAAGSSAPELAAAVIGVFVAQDDIGVGTVVGSAVFNIMFVIGFCALFAGMVVNLNWWPLFRDTFCYAVSIIALVLVMYDGLVTWWEALIFLLLYVGYILIMTINERLERWVHTKCSKLTTFSACYQSLDEKGIPMGNEDEYHLVSTKDTVSSFVHLSNAKIKPGSDDEEKDDLQEEEMIESPCSIPESKWDKVKWVSCLPLTLTLYISVPDCRKRRWQAWYAVTFTMSLIWIGAYSYLLVWMIAIIGNTFGIPDTVMGLTFLSAGVSVPDAIASFLVVKDGYGDMAVSNAIGSNVFDILLCLGLPWFISCIYNSRSVVVYSGGLEYAAITLLTTVFLLFIITHINGWRLTKKYGVILLTLYVILMVLATLYQLNVFGEFNLPDCPV